MDKWGLFKNYLHNELGITKEDIRSWLNDAIKDEARKMVNDTFERHSPRDIIHSLMLEHSFYSESTLHRDIIKEASKLMAEKLEIKVK